MGAGPPVHRQEQAPALRPITWASSATASAPRATGRDSSDSLWLCHVKPGSRPCSPALPGSCSWQSVSSTSQLLARACPGSWARIRATRARERRWESSGSCWVWRRWAWPGSQFVASRRKPRFVPDGVAWAVAQCAKAAAATCKTPSQLGPLPIGRPSAPQGGLSPG